MVNCATQTPGSLLLILTLGVYRKDGKLFIENQAGNGLIQWLRQFERMTLGVKLFPDSEPPANYIPIESLGLGDRLDIFLMPVGWSPPSAIRAFPSMRSQISRLIDRHEYLQFGISSFWGDWAALGALIASRKGRKASVWFDRVESDVLALEAERKSGLRRLHMRLNAALTRHLERRVVKRAALGLFHGRDTYEALSEFSVSPHVVHNIHLKADDRIPPPELKQKADARRKVERPLALNIIYAGRVHPDKGVLDWIETLRLARQAGVNFKAKWLGDGPQLTEARQVTKEAGLAELVSFPGAMTDRAQLIGMLREADLMLFCHLTPESPRCLIESLVSGTPIVGYGSPYSEDLIANHGGGILTEREPAQLCAEMIRLSHDGNQLADLFGRAARDGYNMNDEAVFEHRAELMKLYS